MKSFVTSIFSKILYLKFYLGFVREFSESRLLQNTRLHLSHCWLYKVNPAFTHKNVVCRNIKTRFFFCFCFILHTYCSLLYKYRNSNTNLGSIGTFYIRNHKNENISNRKSRRANSSSTNPSWLIEQNKQMGPPFFHFIYF